MGFYVETSFELLYAIIVSAERRETQLAEVIQSESHNAGCYFVTEIFLFSKVVLLHLMFQPRNLRLQHCQYFISTFYFLLIFMQGYVYH